MPGRKYNGRGVIVRLARREAGLITKGEWHLIRAMRNGGVSISDIARQMGLDRKTVRKALVADCWPDDAAKPRVVRPSKLDPFRDYIRARLEGTPSLSAVRIYEEIAGQGYSRRISILKEFVHEIKEEHRIRAVVRFEMLPGQQAQVDWGYVGSSAILGDDRPIYGFAIVLGYSRMRFVCFTHRMDIHTLMRCHEEAFAYFGGHSREILYDNMKTIIVRPKAADTPALLNPEFASFAGYYGFDIRSCAPYRAQTKGKVEQACVCHGLWGVVRMPQRALWGRRRLVLPHSVRDRDLLSALQTDCAVLFRHTEFHAHGRRADLQIIAFHHDPDWILFQRNTSQTVDGCCQGYHIGRPCSGGRDTDRSIEHAEPKRPIGKGQHHHLALAFALLELSDLPQSVRQFLLVNFEVVKCSAHRSL